jgi:hypothetical protein
MKLKKIFFAFAAIIALNFISPDAFAIAPGLSASRNEAIDNSHLTYKDQLRVAQMKMFISLTPDQYGKLRGKKLNFFGRIALRLTQHRMKQMLKSYDYGDGPDTLQKISWLLKGLLLGPIALILGYIFLKDDDRELIKWIWFGFIGFTAIVVGFLLAF